MNPSVNICLFIPVKFSTLYISLYQQNRKCSLKCYKIRIEYASVSMNETIEHRIYRTIPQKIFFIRLIVAQMNRFVGKLTYDEMSTLFLFIIRSHTSRIHSQATVGNVHYMGKSRINNQI